MKRIEILIIAGGVIVALTVAIGIRVWHQAPPSPSTAITGTSSPFFPLPNATPSSSSSSPSSNQASQVALAQPSTAAGCKLNLNFKPTGGNDQGVGTVNYDLIAKNTGGTTCQSVSISVYYDNGEQFISSQPAATAGYYWRLGNLVAGQEVNISLATARSMPLAPGDDTTQACLSADNGNDACANAGSDASGAAAAIASAQQSSHNTSVAPPPIAVPTLTAFQTAPGTEIGVWQWTALSQLSQSQMQSIIDNAAANRFTVIYQTVDEYLDIDELPEGTEKQQKLASYNTSVSEFLSLAAAKGIAVDAEAGWRDWGESGTTWKASDIMDFVVNYNQTHAGSPGFRGVQYDIEPYLLPNYGANRPTILANYVKLVQQLAIESKATGLPLSIVIPTFYVSSSGKTPEITVNGTNDYTYNFILNALASLPNGRIIVMAYDNTANGSNGSIALSQDEIHAANATNVKVIVAQETGPVSPSYTTFSGLSRTNLFSQTGAIDDAFASDKSFGGIAVDYLDMFLELR